MLLRTAVPLPTPFPRLVTYAAVIERCCDSGLLVGYVPGFPGARSQGESLDELQARLQEVIALLLEEGAPRLCSDFVGLQQIQVPL